MSRAPPFPTRRRSPSHTSGISITIPPPFSPSGTSTTRPLQISRQERPTTPNNGSFTNPSQAVPPNTAPSGPSRPQRSELRSRMSDYSASDQVSTSYRDSISTTRSDASHRPRASNPSNPNTPLKSRPKPQRLQSAPSDDGEQTTPTSLASALSAFKSAGSRRRAMTNGSDDMEYQIERETEIEAERARQQRIRDKVPGRRVNGKAQVGDIDAVLDQVKDGWEFIIDPDFNNVDLALQLLDDSSLGKDMDSFRRTKDMLGKALKGSVDKHYQAFAASLPHQATLLNHLGETQLQIHDARTSILEAKDALGNKRADLVQLWSRGQVLEEMLRILDQIEHLKSVPDLLETLMSEKRLLQAAVLLVRSLKIINKPDMLEIGAVADLRSYLKGQEAALREILIDELQNHLYLKSFWCDGRWSAYVPNQQAFTKVDFEEDVGGKPLPPSESSPTSPSFRPTRQTRFLNDLAIRPNDPPHDLADPSFRGSSAPFTSNPVSSSLSASAPLNPEANSFTYIETLIESLAVLGKLGNALDTVAQRLPNEIFTLVETTLDEVEERAEYSRRGSITSLTGSVCKSEGVYIFSGDLPMGSATVAKGAFLKASCLRLTALESSAKRVDHEILRDLFWTLYSKLDAVAQGLRVIYEVANRVGSRRDFKDSSGTKPGSLFPLAEVWTPVQMEVRTLIHDYLTDEEQSSVSGRNPISSINEILREGKFTRDKSKAVFRFSDTDMKLMNRALKTHEDELTRVLNDTMPGLAPGSSGDVVHALASVGTDDRMLGIDQHHRLIIHPDAFHVSVLFQPTLAFLDRIAEVLPFGLESARTSSAVLDEFVLKVYLPQLEEKVSDLFHQAVTGPEAFQPDSSSTLLSPEPLIKASTHLMALINSLCAMLQTTPFHRENYCRLILGVVIQFYQRCSDKFQDLVAVKNSREGPSELETQLTLAAQWAQRSELHTCLSELLAVSETETAKQQQLCRQETNLELEFLGRQVIAYSDLIPSVRNLAALASLYRSVSWFASELNALKDRPEDMLSPTTPQNLEPLSGATPYTPHIPLSPLSDQLTLPLSREMALRFQALIKTYEQLSALILDSIRIDIRCRAIFYLDSSMRHGNYSLDCEAGEPDPHIVDLNTELGKCDDLVSISLPKKERQFIFAGMGLLMEHMLISNARHLRLPNAFGIKKIMRNMLALQQSIKTLTSDQQHTEFERAKRYYTLFFTTPQAMLDGIRKRRSFSFDEYKLILNFQCGVHSADGDTGVSRATDRNYSLYMIDLHGLELESSGS